MFPNLNLDTILGLRLTTGMTMLRVRLITLHAGNLRILIPILWLGPGMITSFGQAHACINMLDYNVYRTELCIYSILYGMWHVSISTYTRALCLMNPCPRKARRLYTMQASATLIRSRSLA